MDQAEGMQTQGTVPSSTPQVPQDAAQEKVLKQSEVNELVGRIKHEAYQKGLREAQAQQPQSMPQGQSMGGMPQLTEEQVRQMIADEAHKQSQVAAAHNMLTSFAQKMQNGKSKYQDFDETVANLGDLRNIPHVIQLAEEAGNTEDVMYELGKNPGKVATLTTLSYVNPQLAKLEMKKLSDSIKKNQEAQNIPDVSEPLSQIKPSTVGTDNGSLSIRDLKRKSWARG